MGTEKAAEGQSYRVRSLSKFTRRESLEPRSSAACLEGQGPLIKETMRNRTIPCKKRLKTIKKRLKIFENGAGAACVASFRYSAFLPAMAKNDQVQAETLRRREIASSGRCLRGSLACASTGRRTSAIWEKIATLHMTSASYVQHLTSWRRACASSSRARRSHSLNALIACRACARMAMHAAGSRYEH